MPSLISKLNLIAWTVAVLFGGLHAAETQAQQRFIVNPSFEDFETGTSVISGATPPPTGNFTISTDDWFPGWSSTNGTMEIWGSGFQNRTTADGDYIAELNPSTPVGLYQEMCLLNGEVLSWDFFHSARTSSGAPTNQTIVYEVVDSSGTLIQSLTSNTVTEAGSNNNHSSNPWVNVTGSTTYTGPTGVQRLQFRSTNSGAQGNHLDDINVSLVPTITLANDTSDLETGTGPYPTLIVNGEVTSELTITLATAGTATLGDDYTLTSNTITVPVGTYDGVSAGSLFEVPLVVIADGEVEADETVIFTIDSAVAADPLGTPVEIAQANACDTSTPAQATHTIIDVPPTADQVTDTSQGNACTDMNGALIGGNLFTFADNGSFGTGTGLIDEFPATDPYPGGVTGGNFVSGFSGFGHGDYTYVSNHQNRRNGGQYDGTYFDPVNGPLGRFMIVDPDSDAPTMSTTLTGLVPGDSYEVSFWVADSEFGNGPKQRYGVFVDGTEVYNTGFIDGDGVTLSWNKYSFVYQHPTTATSATIDISALEAGAAGRDVFFDEVRVQQCQLQDPALTITKEADVDTDRAAGETITYTYTVENTGNTLISDVTVTDEHTSASGISNLTVENEALGTDAGLLSGDSTDASADGTWDVLAPGDSVTFTSEYVVTLADGYFASELTNTATATGDPVAGSLTNPTDDETVTILASTFTPSLYPVTPQTIQSCANPTVIYSELFDDGTDAGYTSSQSGSAPYGLLDATNNIGNVDATVTDPTVLASLNDAMGVPSPSGGGFISSFDANGGEPKWSSPSLGGLDWTSALNGAIAFELWNHVPNQTAGGYSDKPLYFQIIGDSSKLILDLELADFVDDLVLGNWVTIDLQISTAEAWFYAATTDVNGTSGFTAATDAQIFEVLSSVQNIVVSPESGSFRNYTNVNGISGQITERYAVDAIKIAACDGAQLDVAKSASVGPLQADGTFDVTYTVIVENSGAVVLGTLTLEDGLTAADQLGDAFDGVVSAPVVSLTNTSGLSTAPSANGGYDGTNNLIAGTDGRLAPGDSYTVSFTVTLDPTVATAPATLQNTATAGGLPPGLTPGVDNVSDDSDTDTDPNGDPDTTPNVAGGPGDPTIVTPPTEPTSLGLVKTSELVDSDSSGDITVGDTIQYTYVVTNTSDTLDVYNVTVTEPDTLANPFGGSGGAPTPVHDGISGSDLDGGDGTPTDIAVGETVTFTASYTLTAVDIANGVVENSAVASGTDPLGGTPTDTSDDSDPTDGSDDPTVTELPQPGVEIVKSVASYADTNGNGVVDEGDTLTYAFAVTNTGDTALADVAVTDGLVGIDIFGSPIASLAIGETNDTAVTATYELQAADIVAGGVENTATATGTAVDGNGDPIEPFGPGTPLTATDVSDAGTDPDGDPVTGNEVVETPGLDGSTDSDPTNDPTVFLVTPSPAIEVVKFIGAVNDLNSNGLLDIGDTIDYTFEVTNTGNTALADVTIEDSIADVFGGPISLAIGATDTATFTATYEITAADLLAGGVENTATVSGDAVDADGDPITDPISGLTLTAEDDSDSGSEPLLNSSGDPIDQTDPDTTETAGLDGSTDSDPTNDPTVLIIPLPELTLVKSLANAFDDNIPGGDGLFGGEGDTLVYQFTVTNTGNVDLAGIDITDPLVSMSGGPIDLAVGAGDSLTFTGTYIVGPTDITRGYLENTATAMGDAVDANGDPIYGPTGTLISVQDVSDTGTDPEGDPITDPGNTEEDPNDNPNISGASTPDGDPTNDPTVSKIPGNPNPQLSVIKSVASVADTSGDGMIGEGDTVTYSFSVTNTGNLALADVTVTDASANVSGGPIDLAIGETDTSTFTATSVITAAQAAAGAIENTAEATGGAVNSLGDPILDPDTGLQRVATDTSDAGTEPEVGVSGTPTSYSDPEGNETPDADGNTDSDPTNDPTVLFLPMPELTVTKSVASVADTNGNGFTDAGDTVSYSFAVSNTGNTDLTNVVVTDALPGIAIVGSPIASLLQGDTDTSVTATYVLTAGDIDAGTVENTATATGTAVDDNGDPLGDPTNPGSPLEVTDTSDAGTDPAGDPVASPETTETPDENGNTDGDPTNDPTVFTVEPAPALELTKSVSAINDLDGDGLPGVGDEVVYSFTVTNVGNVDLADVTLTDPLGPVSGGPIDLDIGATDSATFTLTHEITATNIADGAVENTATATGTAVDSGGDPFTDPITGGDLTTSDTSDAGTEPEIGTSGLPEAVTDPEGTETVDGDGATDGDPTNDPTVLVLPMPELTVVKSTSNVFDTNGDGLFGGEDDEVTYQFTIQNTGNVDLVGITLSDSLAMVTGGPIDLAIGEGDSLTFTASYIVTAADITRGYLENTAEATGSAVNGAGDPLLDLNGDPITVSDTSDTGTDPDQTTITNPGDVETPDGSGGTDSDPGNDPTVTTVPANPLPQIEVIKSVASVTDNGDGQLGAGDTVTYSFLVTNTGNVDLGDVTVTDPLVPVTGGPIDLALGATDSTTFTADYVLTADDVAAGGVENTAEATGGAVNSLGQPILDGPGGTQLEATDISDAGTEPEMGSTGTPQTIADPAGNETPDLTGGTDGDLTNDPTVLFIPTPSISVIKSLASASDTNGDGTFGGIGDVITYSFLVTNTGNTALDNIIVTDATASVTGGPISLAVGAQDSNSFTATYTVTANDVNVVGYVENTAAAFGDALGSDGNPLGNPVDPGTPITVTDTSDTGTDRFGSPISDPESTETEDGSGGTDSDPTNDPTVTQVPALPVPAVEIIKSVANVVDTDGDAVLGGEDDTVTYQFDVTNTGNTFLADVVVSDPLLGGVIGTIPVLTVGETASFTVDYVITPDDQERGFIENTATAEGEPQNPLGTPLLDPITLEPLTATDDSDAGTDAETNTISEPGLTETADGSGGTDGDSTNDPTVLTVPLAVPDTGISGIVFLDADEDGTFNDGDTLLANYVVQIVDEDGNVIARTVTDANGFYEMSGFPIGTHTVNFIDPVTGEVVGSLEGLTFGRNTVLLDQNQALDPAASPDQLVLTKTTPLSTVVLGGTVPYVITVTNASAFPVTADIVDTLPTGFVYLPESALLDGAVVEPTISRATLTWPAVTVGIGETITLELMARVGPNAPVGDLTNVVRAFDPETGDPLATPATATVRRNPEAVFDCSDIIGKVFDDRNFDGYQNAPTETGSFSSRGHDITNQDIFVDGKAGKFTPAPSPSSEPGLPNVRLVTPTGTIITTDEYGRYSIPCAELPGGYGTNFTLKLDTRSLPTGYRVTTENPRTMRVTAGIMTELNFGAALGRVVDIDLTGAAFTASNAPVERLEQGIVRVLQQIARSPSVLRISYFSNGESREDVKDRLDQLEDTINATWRRIGDYRLIIERDVKYLQ